MLISIYPLETAACARTHQASNSMRVSMTQNYTKDSRNPHRDHFSSHICLHSRLLTFTKFLRLGWNLDVQRACRGINLTQINICGNAYTWDLINILIQFECIQTKLRCFNINYGRGNYDAARRCTTGHHRPDVCVINFFVGEFAYKIYRLNSQLNRRFQGKNYEFLGYETRQQSRLQFVCNSDLIPTKLRL